MGFAASPDIVLLSEGPIFGVLLHKIPVPATAASRSPGALGSLALAIESPNTVALDKLPRIHHLADNIDCEVAPTAVAIPYVALGLAAIRLPSPSHLRSVHPGFYSSYCRFPRMGTRGAFHVLLLYT